MKLNDYLFIKRNVLDEDFCKHCIDKFNNDEERYEGIVFDGVRTDMKQSTDLTISDKEHWKEEDTVFHNILTPSIKEYLEFLPEHTREVIHNPQDTGYQIQRTDPGGFYHWHHDQWKNRRITFIWYLNDVTEDGYTEFDTGFKVQPETGKMLMFPALWPWVHRGFPPKSEVKYICTGWLYTRANEEENVLDFE